MIFSETIWYPGQDYITVLTIMVMNTFSLIVYDSKFMNKVKNQHYRKSSKILYKLSTSY
jgi:hypothetical protein